MIEGNSGDRVVRFPVFRYTGGAPVEITSSVTYTTQDVSATTGSDHEPVSGTFTFAPGETAKYIDITVHGDTTVEPVEMFNIHLDNITNATYFDLGSSGGQNPPGTILDDDQISTLVVKSTADVVHGSCGANCTLRDAVAASNADADLKQITFDIAPGDPGCTGGVCTITQKCGIGHILLMNPSISTAPGADKLIINGGTGNNRIFRTTSDPNYVRLKGMTIESGDYSFDQGGAVYAITSNLFTLDSVVVRNSTSGDDAGAVSFWQGNFEIINSTFTGNSANNCGAMKLSNGTLTITNSTFSGNTATTGYGGGVCFYGDSSVTIRKSTFANNTAVSHSGGIYNYNGASLNIGDSIVAANTAATNVDIRNDSALASNGYNLIGDNSSSASVFPAGTPNGNNDIVGTTGSVVDPMLGTLGDNGGPTPTLKLNIGSPAIDKGSAILGLTTDQRGLDRVYDNPAIGNAASGNGSDIGAFEVQAVPVPTITLDTTRRSILVTSTSVPVRANRTRRSRGSI